MGAVLEKVLVIGDGIAARGIGGIGDLRDRAGPVQRQVMLRRPDRPSALRGNHQVGPVENGNAPDSPEIGGHLPGGGEGGRTRRGRDRGGRVFTSPFPAASTGDAEQDQDEREEKSHINTITSRST